MIEYSSRTMAVDKGMAFRPKEAGLNVLYQLYASVNSYTTINDYISKVSPPRVPTMFRLIDTVTGEFIETDKLQDFVLCLDDYGELPFGPSTWRFLEHYDYAVERTLGRDRNIAYQWLDWEGVLF